MWTFACPILPARQISRRTVSAAPTGRYRRSVYGFVMSLFPALIYLTLLLNPGEQGGCAGARPIAEARQLPVGSTVTVEGHVTAATESFQPGQSFALQDETAGLYVFRSAGIGRSLTLGDHVCVSGRLESYRGMLELIPARASDVRRLGSGPAPSAQPLESQSVGEGSEGRLVVVQGVVSAVSPRSLTVDGVRVYLDEDAGIEIGGLRIGCQVAVTGLSADFDGPQLWPRSSADLVTLSCPGSACQQVTVAQVQGAGAYSPLVGREGTYCLAGCITGVASEGFFVQSLAADSDPRTSEGIYVYRHPDWENPRQLAAGDRVELRNFTVQEYYNSTEIVGLSDDTANSVQLTGRCDLPEPVTIAPLASPWEDAESAYERYEGMRVTLTFEGRTAGPTTRYASRFPGGEPEIAVVDRNHTLFGERVFARDWPLGSGLLYLTGGLGVDVPDLATGSYLAGDGVSGILAYQFGRYALLVDQAGAKALRAPESEKSQPIEAPWTVGPTEYGICSFNVENLFDHVDDWDGDLGDWSPASAAEYRRELERRAVAIRSALSGCSVIALQEVEGKDAVWQALARGTGGYRYDYLESADGRDITNGILYDPARVKLLASMALQHCSATDYLVDYTAMRGARSTENPCATGEFPIFSRPPYQVDLTVRSRDGRQQHVVTVIVNHLKSKRGDEEDNAPLRLAQAQVVADALSDLAGSGRLAVALGDLNDDLGSASLEAFRSFPSLYYSHLPPSEWYSYVFNGGAEALDHFGMTAALDRYYRSGALLRINADYPDLVIPDSGGRRSSDHDPIFVRFSFVPTGISNTARGAAVGAWAAFAAPAE